MGVFSRPDSPVWWIYLETTHTKERTAFRIGTTTSQRQDSKRLAVDRYHQRMNEIAARLYKLPIAQPTIRFTKYADAYAAHVISHHRGKGRELELLAPLRQFFADDLLTAIDPDRVRAYMTARRVHVSASTVNREVDVLKSMLREAVPTYLATSPLKGLKKLATIKPRRRLLSAEEETRLLEKGDAQDRALLILGLDTLLRLGDLLELEHRDYAAPWLYVRDPKSGEPYQVALSPRASQAIEALPSTKPMLFPKFRRGADPRDWSRAARQRFAYLCKLADVPYGKAQGGVTFHWATRRTGATRMLMQHGVPLPVVQRHGNWKHPDVLLRIYADVGQADLLKAVGSFPTPSRQRRK